MWVGARGVGMMDESMDNVAIAVEGSSRSDRTEMPVRWSVVVAVPV